LLKCQDALRLQQHFLFDLKLHHPFCDLVDQIASRNHAATTPQTVQIPFQVHDLVDPHALNGIRRLQLPIKR